MADRVDGLYRSFDMIGLQRLLASNATSRSELVSKLNDTRRNLDDECGYPSTSALTVQSYRDLFDRDPVANRVVSILPLESWSSQPTIVEDPDAETLTDFEEAFQDMSIALFGDSHYKDEEVNPVWSYLLRADVLSGIGSFGVVLLGLDDGRELPEEPKRVTKLLFLRPFDESLVQINRYEQDMRNPRFGQPIEYRITLNDPNDQLRGGTGLSVATYTVHWKRVIHLADNLVSSDIFGTPRCRPVYNRLYDLQKLYGGSAEMYWRGAFPGFSFETNPQLGGDVIIDREAMKDELEQWMNGLQRYMLLSGMSAKSLSPQVSDPTGQIQAQIDAICVQLAIPKRIFLGSERGELASSQDAGSWNDRMIARQNLYLTPRVIVPFVDRLIDLGVLPEPENFMVMWPDLESLTEAEQAAIALQRTDAMAKYVGGGIESLMPPMDYLTRVLQFSQADAETILEAAAEIIEEKQAEAEAQQKEQMELETKKMEQEVELAKAKGEQAPPGTGQPPSAPGQPPPPPGRPKPPSPPVAGPVKNQLSELVLAFDPSQARDKAGKWTAGAMWKYEPGTSIPPSGETLGAYLKHKGAPAVALKLTPLQLKKIEIINPEGITDGTLKIPVGPLSKNKEAIAKLGAVLPPGTKIVAVHAGSTKKGLGEVGKKGKVVSKGEPAKSTLGAWEKGESAPTTWKHTTTIEPLAYKPSSQISGVSKEAGGSLPFPEVTPEQKRAVAMATASLPTRPTYGATIEVKGHATKSKEASHQWSASLTANERRAVKVFNEAHAVGKWTGSSAQIRKEVAGKIDKTNLSSDFMSAIDKAPNYKGTVYRGIPYGDYATEQRASILKQGVGGIWSDPSPHSTSISPKKASSFGKEILFKIKTKTGADIRARSILDEAEIVGRPNTQYRINAIHLSPKVSGIGYFGQTTAGMVVELEEA